MFFWSFRKQLSPLPPYSPFNLLHVFLVVSLMSLTASLMTTSRMQQCFNVMWILVFTKCFSIPVSLLYSVGNKTNYYYSDSNHSLSCICYKLWPYICIKCRHIHIHFPDVIVKYKRGSLAGYVLCETFNVWKKRNYNDSVTGKNGDLLFLDIHTTCRRRLCGIMIYIATIFCKKWTSLEHWEI